MSELTDRLSTACLKAYLQRSTYWNRKCNIFLPFPSRQCWKRRESSEY